MVERTPPATLLARQMPEGAQLETAALPRSSSYGRLARMGAAVPPRTISAARQVTGPVGAALPHRGTRNSTRLASADRSSQAEAAAWPRCLAAEARVDCSHVSRAPTRTHPLRVGRRASDPLGVRSSRRGSGCGGVRRVPRVHCGLHRRVAPQGRRRSSRRRPVRPRRLVRGLVQTDASTRIASRQKERRGASQPALSQRTTDEGQVRLIGHRLSWEGSAGRG